MRQISEISESAAVTKQTWRPDSCLSDTATGLLQKSPAGVINRTLECRQVNKHLQNVNSTQWPASESLQRFPNFLHLRTPWQPISINCTLHISVRVPLGVGVPQLRDHCSTGKWRVVRQVATFRRNLLPQPRAHGTRSYPKEGQHLSKPDTSTFM